uniref:Uncharacterized protein n=1 Tax=Chlamydomonas euryale TaxID=1486919 RepID=A0A7R9V1J1_9CHLO|mmetsp:Transcript_14443/g.42067  ORF Transcript_14443/g.42067 Transcript_14443/m.42067 type:complete len:645 (+) Transcript_14443:499-2433(+)
MAALDAKCSCALNLATCNAPPAENYFPERDDTKWIAIAYTVCIFVVAALAIYAFVRAFLWARQKHRDQNAEEYTTARNTQSGLKIGFSFFASAIGAWVVAAPSSFAVYTGYVGLLMYSIASGMPVLVLAFCGGAIRKKFPDILSIGDFTGRRFGPVFRTVTVLIVMFNMGVAMLAEYTTIGSLFEDYVGNYAWPMIMTVGILTMAYTIYGGLYVSIATDQIQAIASITLITLLTIYVAVTFRPPYGLPKPIPNDVVGSRDYDTGYVNWPLGANKFGYSAIFSMPAALVAATVFSEAMWQKAWASEDRKALIFGGSVGFVLITITVFLFGLGGWLAAWAGYVNWSTNGNLFLFQVFKSELVTGCTDDNPYCDPNFIYNGASARLQSWVGVITIMLASIMNCSAIDSLQNGLTSAISNQWFRNQNILFARVIVLACNVPVMVVATQKYSILQLFLIANMLGVCWFLPVLSGLWDFTTDFVGENGCLFSGSFAVLWSVFYGAIRASEHTSGGEAVECGAWYSWWGNYNYEWDYFLVACGASFVGMVMWGSIKYALWRLFGFKGRSLSQLIEKFPGFTFITGGGLEFDLMEKIGLARFAYKSAKPIDSTSNSGSEDSVTKAKAIALEEYNGPITVPAVVEAGDARTGM